MVLLSLTSSSSSFCHPVSSESSWVCLHLTHKDLCLDFAARSRKVVSTHLVWTCRGILESMGTLKTTTIEDINLIHGSFSSETTVSLHGYLHSFCACNRSQSPLRLSLPCSSLLLCNHAVRLPQGEAFVS